MSMIEVSTRQETVHQSSPLLATRTSFPGGTTIRFLLFWAFLCPPQGVLFSRARTRPLLTPVLVQDILKDYYDVTRYNNHTFSRILVEVGSNTHELLVDEVLSSSSTPASSEKNWWERAPPPVSVDNVSPRRGSGAAPSPASTTSTTLLVSFEPLLDKMAALFSRYRRIRRLSKNSFVGVALPLAVASRQRCSATQAEDEPAALLPFHVAPWDGCSSLLEFREDFADFEKRAWRDDWGRGKSDDWGPHEWQYCAKSAETRLVPCVDLGTAIWGERDRGPPGRGRAQIRSRIKRLLTVWRGRVGGGEGEDRRGEGRGWWSWEELVIMEEGRVGGGVGQTITLPRRTSVKVCHFGIGSQGLTIDLLKVDAQGLDLEVVLSVGEARLRRGAVRHLQLEVLCPPSGGTKMVSEGTSTAENITTFSLYQSAVNICAGSVRTLQGLGFQVDEAATTSSRPNGELLCRSTPESCCASLCGRVGALELDLRMEWVGGPPFPPGQVSPNWQVERNEEDGPLASTTAHHGSPVVPARSIAAVAPPGPSVLVPAGTHSRRGINNLFQATREEVVSLHTANLPVSGLLSEAVKQIFLFVEFGVDPKRLLQHERKWVWSGANQSAAGGERKWAWSGANQSAAGGERKWVWSGANQSAAGGEWSGANQSAAGGEEQFASSTVWDLTSKEHELCVVVCFIMHQR